MLASCLICKVPTPSLSDFLKHVDLEHPYHEFTVSDALLLDLTLCQGCFMLYDGHDGASHEPISCRNRQALKDIYQSALNASDADTQLDWSCPACKAPMGSGTELVDHYRLAHPSMPLQFLAQPSCIDRIPKGDREDIARLSCWFFMSR